jgi:hypothetical protein
MSAQKDVIFPMAFHYTEDSGQLTERYNRRNQHARTPSIFHRHDSFSARNASPPIAFESRPLQSRVIDPRWNTGCLIQNMNHKSRMQ